VESLLNQTLPDPTRPEKRMKRDQRIERNRISEKQLQENHCYFEEQHLKKP
jgi:hypothetical protein